MASRSRSLLFLSFLFSLAEEEVRYNLTEIVKISLIHSFSQVQDFVVYWRNNFYLFFFVLLFLSKRRESVGLSFGKCGEVDLSVKNITSFKCVLFSPGFLIYTGPYTLKVTLVTAIKLI